MKVYGFIIITLLLLIGNQDVTLNAGTKEMVSYVILLDYAISIKTTESPSSFEFNGKGIRAESRKGSPFGVHIRSPPNANGKVVWKPI